MPQQVVPATPRAILQYLSSRQIASPPATPAGGFTFDEVTTLWRFAEEATHDARIGLHVAELVPYGSFGPPEHLMLTSATLQAALRRLLQFYSLVNQGHELALDNGGGTARLHVFRRGGSPTLRSYADFVLASIRRRMEMALGRPFVHSIENGHLAFDTSLLRATLPAGDEELCRAIEGMAAGRLERQSFLADDVRDLVLRGEYEVGRVAARIGSSSRTLQRRLVECGTSFRAVVDEVRRTETLRLLRQGEAPKRIADAVGFGEVRSFYRAFRRWTGVSPRVWLSRRDSFSADPDSTGEHTQHIHSDSCARSCSSLS